MCPSNTSNLELDLQRYALLPGLEGAVRLGEPDEWFQTPTLPRSLVSPPAFSNHVPYDPTPEILKRNARNGVER